MTTPEIVHEVIERHGVKVHVVTVGTYRCSIPECQCGARGGTCLKEHLTRDARTGKWFFSRVAQENCSRNHGTCHPTAGWHLNAIEAHLSALERTYTPAGRKHRPSMPSRGGYAPTGKPEEIARYDVEGNHAAEPVGLFTLLGRPERVRELLALARAGA